MTPRSYYNEIDEKAAAWLRELIKRGLVADGEVDTRSITDVRATDLHGFTQCHFFAGIGGWSYALRLAGWSDDRPVWTGSCPCQPFSCAGKQLGQADERHLWPVFANLIRECRPPIVFGEQVASKPVTGGFAGKVENLQEMRDRQAVLGVLRQLQRGSPINVHGLREAIGTNAQTRELRESICAAEVLQRRVQGLCACERCQAQGEIRWDGVRLGQGQHPEASKCGGLRIDWDSILSDHAEIMERSISGQDQLGQGVHDGQRARGSVRAECDGEHMGREQDSDDCVCDFCEEKPGVGTVVGCDWDATSGEADPCWLDGVRADLEAEGYAVGAAVLGSHSFGAPHIRQRLYWVADSACGRKQRCDAWPDQWTVPGANVCDCGVANAKHDGGRTDQQGRKTEGRAADGRACGLANAQHPHGRSQQQPECARCGRDGSGGVCKSDGLADPARGRCGIGGGASGDTGHVNELCPACPGCLAGIPCRMVYSERTRLEGQPRHEQDGNESRRNNTEACGHASTSGATGAWSDFDILRCLDEKARRVPTEPAFFPLADGIPARVVRLRGYGNAICVPTAVAFIEAAEEVINEGL